MGMLHQLQSSLCGNEEMQLASVWGVGWKASLSTGKSKKSEGIRSLTQRTSGASDGEAEHWPPDQKVPSWNLIISTVSRLKFKLCAAVWRPSGQGLTESPLIRNASYYHNPESYLNSSLMRL